MEDHPVTSLELWVQTRAKSLFGPAAQLKRRIFHTRAGPHHGLLVTGYRIVLSVEGRDGEPGRESILGLSPPYGSPLDLGTSPDPEDAIEDALRRGAAGLPPYEDDGGNPFLALVSSEEEEAPPVPLPALPSDLSTSSMELPVG